MTATQQQSSTEQAKALFKKQLRRLRCLTDKGLVGLHEHVFSSRGGRQWGRWIPDWAFREDLEHRIAFLLAVQKCELHDAHPVGRRLMRKAREVLQRPIRTAAPSAFPVLNKQRFMEHLDAEPQWHDGEAFEA